MQPNERWRRHHINLSQFYQKPRSRWCQRQDTGSPISHKKELKEGLCKMNQNEPIFLNLYIRDTESYRKDTKIVGNKQIMRVKKLISFYEILHFFSIFLVHNLLSRWLKEYFPIFCISHVKIWEKSVSISEISGKNKKASEIFRNLRLLIKGGGYLLSRIALQYHRRKWA